MKVKLVLTLVVVLLLVGCWPTAQPPTSTPALATPAPRPTPTAPAQAQPVGGRAKPFAEYIAYEVKVSPSVPKYGFSLEGLSNPELAKRLSVSAREKLERNGFVVVEERYPQLYEPYKRAKDQGVPIFVSTDAVLHTFHILYDYALRSAELEHFIADLEALTAAMLEGSREEYAQSQGVVKEAALRNLAYFGVAARLLDMKVSLPAEADKLVKAELALIEAHQGFAPSPIFGYREDYSQYVPRGHYTRNEAFGRYFKAMMWYGRMSFRLKPGTRPEDLAQGREETRRAILMVAALEKAQIKRGAALAVWERIYQPTVFFVGQTDDLNIYDYMEVMDRVLGKELSSGALAEDAKIDAFIKEALALRPPRIVSSYVTDREDPSVVTKGFRFMGQRFIPDSYMFQQLVYNQVGTPEKPRLFPKGLDVLAVLGSERAYHILTEVYDEDQYAKYAEQVAKLRKEFAELPAGEWTQNLYWNWLHSLRPLVAPKGEGYPAFMRSTAWQDKELHTALGSWTELRHDTILYAKQSYTLKVTGIQRPPEPARGYVEPNPEVYARLAALARQMRTGLKERGLLPEEYAQKLERLEELLLALKTMAEKELRGEALSQQEEETIRNIGSLLEDLTTFTSREAKEATSEADERMALVADVHTDVNTARVLEEGVGDAFLVYVIVPIAGKPTLAQGTVFSYYEFLQPMADRLTDEAWQKLSPKPEPPVWTESFLVKEARGR